MLFYILQIFSVSAKHCLKYRNIIVEYFKRIVYSLYIFLWRPDLFNKAIQRVRLLSLVSLFQLS